MTLRKFTFILLALVLAAPCLCLYAEPIPSSSTPLGTTAINADSIQALKNMGAYLQTLTRFQVKLILSSEVVLEDGQKLQQSSEAEIQVQRTNKLRALMRSARSERELVYDGKTVTIYTPALKYYSRTETASTIVGMEKQLEEKYGLQLPFSDLFSWGTDAAPLDQIESAMNAGQDFIDQELCDHYAFRQGSIDWQIWISVGKKPLPRKIVITSRADEARPQSVYLLTWNLKPTFQDSVFKFTPPKDAYPIGIRPLNTK